VVHPSSACKCEIYEFALRFTSSVNASYFHREYWDCWQIQAPGLEDSQNLLYIIISGKRLIILNISSFDVAMDDSIQKLYLE
jgi:hypothetical protein